MGEVFIVASGKGGTGKTMFATNFAVSLANLKKKVVVVDMDLGLRNLDLYFGLENYVVYDVYDVLTGVCRIKQALIRDKRFESLYMLAASPCRGEDNLTPLHVKVLCERLSEQFDYIIIDGPSGIGDELTMAAAGADKAVIVANPEYSSLRDADILDNEIRKIGIEKRYVVLNKVVGEIMTAGIGPDLKEVSEILKPELAGIIQFDHNIMISTNLGSPISMKKGTYIQKNFQNIVKRLI